MIPGACYLIYDADNGELHQIKTNQAKKRKLASCPELGSAQPQLVFFFDAKFIKPFQAEHFRLSLVLFTNEMLSYQNHIQHNPLSYTILK